MLLVADYSSLIIFVSYIIRQFVVLLLRRHRHVKQPSHQSKPLLLALLLSLIISIIHALIEPVHILLSIPALSLGTTKLVPNEVGSLVEATANVAGDVLDVLDAVVEALIDVLGSTLGSLLDVVDIVAEVVADGILVAVDVLVCAVVVALYFAR